MTDEEKQVTTSCCGKPSSSTTDEEKTEKEIIREQYRNIAKMDESLKLVESKELTQKVQLEKSFSYSKEELNKIPKGSNMGLGSGNPVALSNIQFGETVVDLGSGPGGDCFLAANKVGTSGHVIGIDMTPEMIDKARALATMENYQNVEFRLGEIEHLPIADNTADLIISNCVINLASDKSQVFREALRVLKPGGRLIISDIMFANKLPDPVSEAFKGMNSCISRSVLVEEYLETINEAGFENVELINKMVISQRKRDGPRETKDGKEKVTMISDGKKIELLLTPEELKMMENAILSAHIRAYKPN